jgi:hypothetical protein
VTPIPYGIKTLNGELVPWRLWPRAIPMPEETPVVLKLIRVVQSHAPSKAWASWLSKDSPLTLPSGSEQQYRVASTGSFYGIREVVVLGRASVRNKTQSYILRRI